MSVVLKEQVSHMLEVFCSYSTSLENDNKIVIDQLNGTSFVRKKKDIWQQFIEEQIEDAKSSC